jgi:histidine ammonia-lyase
MPIELATRADFTLSAYRAAAWRAESVTIAASAKSRMAERRRQFMNLIDSDPSLVIYGVTTGYGQNAKNRLAPDARKAHARTPPYGAAAAFGPPLPARVVRGFVFARLANYVEGHAAVRPELAEAVAALLKEPKLPKVSAMGQGGAGEILGLAPLFYRLAEKFELGEKESLALVNGSPCGTALIADAVIAMERRLELAEQILALSAEAIKAPLSHFAPEFEELWNDPHETAALQSLRRLLDGADGERRPYQAPVSYRILPRVLGQFRRALAQAKDVAEHSLRAITDNPVFLAPDSAHPMGRVYSTGGYHNAAAYPALDNLAASAADLCTIADKHGSKLLDGRFSLLPDQLMVGAGYIGCLNMVQVGFAEEAKRAAQRTFLPGSEGGGFGQNDTAPPTFIAWRAQEQAGYCLDAALGALAVIASQAFFATQRKVPAALAPLIEEIRKIVPPMQDPRPLAEEMDRLLAAIRSRIYDVADVVRDPEQP